jgi:hypothetical protein
MTKPAFTLAVIGRDSLLFLRESFEAALAAIPPPAEILYVDDRSSDGSADWVRVNYPVVKVFVLPERKGPSGARNAAIDAAANDLVFLADSDASPAPGCAALLYEALLSDHRAVIAVPTVMSAGTGVVQHGGARCHLLGLSVFENYLGQGNRLEEGVPLSSCGTTALMIHKRRLPADMRFDERFLFYCEDTDFALRAAIRGFKILHKPAALVFHSNVSALEELRGEVRYPDKKFFYQTRNRRWLILKNYQFSTLVLSAPLQLLFELAGFLFALTSGGGAAFLRGLFSSAAGLPYVLACRWREQAARKVCDSELLSVLGLSIRPSARRSAPALVLFNVFLFLCRFWWGLVLRMLSWKHIRFGLRTGIIKITGNLM